MAKMGDYCKAYPISRFREFPGWKEKAENAKPEKLEKDGRVIEVPRKLTDDGHLFLQETFVVTDGIFLDENVIFDEVTAEWREFCYKALNFEVPDYAISQKAEGASSGN
jgi:hypothetical protein